MKFSIIDHLLIYALKIQRIHTALAIYVGVIVLGFYGSFTYAQSAEKTLSTPQGDIVYEVIRGVSNHNEDAILLVGLHGYGADVKQISASLNVKPEIPHAYVAIRGIHQLSQNRFAWFDVASVNDVTVYNSDQLSKALEILALAIPNLSERMGVKNGRVYIIGFSQGATLALHIAKEKPELAAGFVAFSGDLMSLATERREHEHPRKPPILLGYGTKDRKMDADSLKKTALYFHDRDHPIQLQDFPVPHVVTKAGREAIDTWIEDVASGKKPSSGKFKLKDINGPKHKASPIFPLELVLNTAEQRGAVFGNSNGSKVVYKFFDYNCGACRAAHVQLESFLPRHNDLKLVMVETAVFGEESVRASALALNINAAVDYRFIVNASMKKSGGVNGETIKQFVQSNKIELHNGRNEQLGISKHYLLDANVAAMSLVGIRGTPGFYINGKARSGLNISWLQNQLQLPE